MSLEILRLATRKPTHTHKSEVFLIDERDCNVRNKSISTSVATLFKRLERKREYQRQCYAKMPEHRKERQRQRLKEKRELVYAAQKRWRDKNPEKAAAIRRRSYKKYKASFSKEDWAVYQRQKNEKAKAKQIEKFGSVEAYRAHIYALARISYHKRKAKKCQ